MKFTWVYALCLAVAGASAQSFDSGFRLNGFNNLNRRCDSGFGISTPVIETSQVRIPFVAPTIAQPTCDCIKAIVRPQIRKEIITIPSVQRFFPTSPSSLIQAIPLLGARNIRIPAVPFPSSKVFAEVVPAPIVNTGTRIFSENVLNTGSSIPRPVCALNGHIQGVLNGAFLGNSLEVGPELRGSFSGTLDASFAARGNGVMLTGSSVLGGGFSNEELGNNC